MPDLKADSSQLVEIRGLSKSFPGVKALDSVNFTLRRGEIHALMGENGAGKSTLIKVLTGLHKKDKGSIKVDGLDFESSSPMDASSKGISTVYQEINLVPNLSVAENIFIGRQPMKFGMVDWKLMNQKAKEALKKLDIDIDVTIQLSQYSIAIQQMIAIARSLDIKAKILILDEPTSSLDLAECEQLFSIMNKLKEEGMGIIFITHFLDQVYQNSDYITVLRNGSFVGEYPIKELPKLKLISKMLGKEITDINELNNKIHRDYYHNDKKMFVKMEGIERKGVLSRFDMDIREGEVLGLVGLLGSGRTEMAKILFGIDKHTSGYININGNLVNIKSPRDAISHSLAFCPEDRKTEGIIPDLTVRENIVLALQAKNGILHGLKRKEQEDITSKFIKLLQIKVSGLEQMAGTLSGGNQQKLILARWLAMNPKLLILDEPTRGIDIGAKSEIEKLINKMSEDNMSVLFISSELDEVIRCCSRAAILKDRKKIGELYGEKLTENTIMNYIAKDGYEL
ncbi:MAG: sugar ABC transporter ATP-binding protein [Spirochaetales bacterium]|nr:sugar ABC transporter ATP-binding protein [Spirochaetales bacterium]